ISEKGTLQLSIDTDSVRRLLLDFPRAALGGPSGGGGADDGGGGAGGLGGAADTASYSHYVEREMGGAVNLVKVLQAAFSRSRRAVEKHAAWTTPDSRHAAAHPRAARPP
ncbi:hypothetical protein MNEG_16327, partial [Monoraphidium neglectum]